MQNMRLVAAVVSLAAALCLSGCATGTGATSSTSSATTPAATLVAEKCVQCHGLDRVWAASKDRAGWTETLTRMQSHGLQVTDAEKGTILDYLASGGASQ